MTWDFVLAQTPNPRAPLKALKVKGLHEFPFAKSEGSRKISRAFPVWSESDLGFRDAAVM
jgi:hypothetical protein